MKNTISPAVGAVIIVVVVVAVALVGWKMFGRSSANTAAGDAKHGTQMIGTMSQEQRAKIGEQMKANEEAMAKKLGGPPGRGPMQQPTGAGGGQ